MVGLGGVCSLPVARLHDSCLEWFSWQNVYNLGIVNFSGNIAVIVFFFALRRLIIDHIVSVIEVKWPPNTKLRPGDKRRWILRNFERNVPTTNDVIPW